jgi:hypothetical protein
MAIVDECGTCEDYPLSTPTKRQKTGGKIYELGNLPNPIPDEVRDTDDIRAGLLKCKLVPYAGTVNNSGDSLMDFLIMLSKLSPTAANCKESIKSFAFGGGIDIQKSNGVFSFYDDQELSLAEKESFANEVLSNVMTPSTDLEELGQSLFDDMKATGNQWLEVRLYTVAGQQKASIIRHSPKTVRYEITERDKQRFVLVSQLWTAQYLSKNEPQRLPLYPTFVESEDGTLKTIIHCKQGNEFWYGRPESMGSLVYQYREFQDSMYLTKQAANNFTGQVVIEVEDDNPEESNLEAQRAGFENEADRLHENFTTQGDNPQSIFYTVRPHGARPMFMRQIEPNTNESWYKVTGEIAENKIIASFSWSKRLMIDDIGAGFSSQIFMDRLKTLLPTIRKNQDAVAKPINMALEQIVKWFGLDSRYEKVGIKYNSPYRSILQETQENENGNTDNSTRGN